LRALLQEVQTRGHWWP